MHGRGNTMGVPHHKKTLEERENEWTWTFKSINDTVETKVFVLLKLIFGEGNGTPTPVLLPRKSHGWRSLVGCSPWGH